MGADEKEKKGERVFYDPPLGWQYGFPKIYSPRPGESLMDTLIRDGYPPDLADKWANQCRFIY